LEAGVGVIQTASKGLEAWNEFLNKNGVTQQTKPDCMTIAFDVL
jgi:hypothetical protein